jgi:glycolate oxidase FAD binding subunit
MERGGKPGLGLTPAQGETIHNGNGQSRVNPLDDALVSSVRPSTVAELGHFVRQAALEQKAVYPLGGRTMLHFGLPATRRGIGIDLTGLDQVIDYPARDMTITVQAGITMTRLGETLAREKQWLPIDVPHPERATLGGSIASNISGARRLGFGTLRDYVIGITVVNDRGLEAKAGGRVVKNVAGYDLCKLYTGSLGTLGIISQMTLKVRPRPEVSVAVHLTCPDGELHHLLGLLHNSQTQPAFLTLASSERTSPPGPWRFVVGFEDRQETAFWQAQQLRSEITLLAHGGVKSTGWYCTDPPRFWSAVPGAGAEVAFLAHVLPHSLADFCLKARPLVQELHAYAGCDVVVGLLPRGLDQQGAIDTIRRLRRIADEAQGNLVLHQCPDDWKQDVGVWGEPRGDWELMRSIKRQLDPQNLFNPGRFVAGI